MVGDEDIVGDMVGMSVSALPLLASDAFPAFDMLISSCALEALDSISSDFDALDSISCEDLEPFPDLLVGIGVIEGANDSVGDMVGSAEMVGDEDIVGDMVGMSVSALPLLASDAFPAFDMLISSCALEALDSISSDFDALDSISSALEPLPDLLVGIGVIDGAKDIVGDMVGSAETDGDEETVGDMVGISVSDLPLLASDVLPALE